MPTLAQEPMIWPDSLLDVDARHDGHWWVLHVKPRAEKAFARNCYSRQVGFYLPQCRHQRQSQGCVKSSFLPLFPGYVFLFGDEHDRVVALETNMVVNVLSVPNQLELFEDLGQIKKVIDSDLAILPQDRLQPGAPVTVVGGPLVGCQGTVIRRKNKTTLTVKVSFLQQGASVDIDDWMVEPIASPLRF